MLKIFDNKFKLAVAFCDELLEILSKDKSSFIALSGGSTPVIIFQTLAEMYKDKTDWNKVHLFWSDERIVPPDNSESNFGTAKKYLLSRINIPGGNIHPVNGNNNPAFEVMRYSEEIRIFVPYRNGLPKFDLMMLGIGKDGHTASIFPDQMNLIDSENICEISVHPGSGQKRITLTGTVINNAENVIFLATGKEKSVIIKELIENKTASESKYPAALIDPAEGTLKYFIDKEAASLLKH